MKEPRNLRQLLLKSGSATTMVNLITLYRIVTFPVLIILLFIDQLILFRWMLLASFLTDALDGFLARRYHVTSKLGAKLDSLGDNLTIVASLVGILLLKPNLIYDEMYLFIILLVLFIIQVSFAIIKYRKISSFHTYLAKAAAILQGLFMLSFFFLDEVIYPLFYTAMVVTMLELIEEIIITHYLPKPKENVRGLYWVLNDRKVSGERP